MSRLTALRQIVKGAVYLPDDPRFGEESLAWNLAVSQEPSAVVHVADEADVAALVRAAPDLGVVLATQPTGHGATGTATRAVVVRTAALDTVAVDVATGTARVGAGVKWGDFNAHLAGTGLIGLAGSTPDVNMTGYHLGGGLSWFGRRYGIASSHLRAVEIVDGSGSPSRIDDASDPDLMWALRGGGGEFGIVTALHIDLPREPQLFGGQIVFPMGQAAAIVQAYRDVTSSAWDGLTMWLSLMHVPDLPIAPEGVRGKSVASVLVTWLGPADAADEQLSRLRSAGTVLMDSVGPLSIADLGSVAAEPTDPLPFLDWGDTLRTIDDASVAALLESFTDRARTPLLQVEVRHVGGAFTTTAPGRPGAFDHLPGQYTIRALGLPMAPGMAEAIIEAISGIRSAVAGVSLDQVPPTFLDDRSSVSRTFDDTTIQRLLAVKGRVDPHGTFRGRAPFAT